MNVVNYSPDILFLDIDTINTLLVLSIYHCEYEDLKRNETSIKIYSYLEKTQKTFLGFDYSNN